MRLSDLILALFKEAEVPYLSIGGRWFSTIRNLSIFLFINGAAVSTHGHLHRRPNIFEEATYP